MESNVTQEGLIENAIAERRVWTAVILLAIEDWKTGTLRMRREAQTFLFENQRDFEDVCANAGLNAANLRAQLRKAGRLVEMQGPLSRPLAA
ncbi:MAG: hypothetical protein ACRD4M_00910 [Candidatus Acidiferrales bacterium]